MSFLGAGKNEGRHKAGRGITRPDRDSKAVSKHDVDNHKTTHHYSDVDDDVNSLHHTLGKGPSQAAAGNHTHVESVPLGCAVPLFGPAVAPTGWAILDGSFVRQSDAPRLYKLWGPNRYAVDSTDGSGAPTFRLPSVAGRFLIGQGTFAGNDANDGLTEPTRSPRHTHGNGTLGTSNEGAHTHPPGTLAVAVANNAPTTGTGPKGLNPITGATGAGSNHTHTITGTSGQSGNADIPYHACNWIIRLQ